MQSAAAPRARFHLRSASLLLICSLAPFFARAQGESGAAIYARACAACHGDDGRGRAQSQVGFETPLPNFTDCDYASRERKADWFAIVHQGGPVRGFNRMMPAFGRALTDDEISTVVDYVRSLCRDASWPRGELNLPRALFTEKAYPEDEAVSNTTIQTEGPNSFTQQIIWEQRFGVRNMIEIDMPFHRADLGDAFPSSTGAGDLSVAVKHTLSHSLERGSILSVGGEVSLPTGDEAKGFGAGTTVFEPFVAYGKILPRDSFVQVHALAEIPASDRLEDEIGLRTAIGRTWTQGGGYGRSWTPMLELLAARELTSGADTELDVVPQLQVSLSRRQHIMAGAGFRVPATQRSDRATQFVFYLLWDWYDGGVLEGW
ncbi:MAG TPA: cytochrome c [Gammaproteobacteria bacterium]|nr:cytochrome c [Gammaproteobacteria bacterium]